jgi:hypothetical protein
MTRRVWLLLILITLWSLAVALGAVAWRWREAGDIAAIFAGPKPQRAVMIFFAPLVLAGCLVFLKHAQTGHKPGPYETGFVGLTMITNFALVAAIQVWMIVRYLGEVSVDKELVFRLIATFMGLSMAVRGNFFAKLGAPGEDPTGAWSRTTRCTAVILVVTGLALAACASALPMPGVLSALGGTFLVILLLIQAQRKASAQLLR